VAIGNAGKVIVVIKGAIPKLVILSGTVSVSSGLPVRQIVAWRHGIWDVPVTTFSDSSGNWSIEINGSSSQEFVILCVGGVSTENSAVFDHVTE